MSLIRPLLRATRPDEPLVAEIVAPWFHRHIAGVIRGLYELAAAGSLKVRYADSSDLPAPLRAHTLLVRFFRPGMPPLSFVYDTWDRPEVPSEELVSLADFYIKRSYSATEVAKLPRHLIPKVHPYGLSLPASIERDPLSFGYYWHRLFEAHDHADIESRKQRLVAFLKNAVFKVTRHKHSGYALDPSFFPRPDWNALAKKPRIFYQTRVWDPAHHVSRHHRTIEELNDQRIELVRRLRKELGAYFNGGVIPGEYAQRRCPDALTELGTDFTSYLHHMQHCLIGVTEAGIHGSNGARLPELLGSGRCVVSERLFYQPIVMPEDRKEILFYSSVDQCLSHCSNLLAYPAQAVEIARGGLDFYSREVAPAALARRVLTLAGLEV